ncbi:P-loop containing nucleoside triphosphate hydrolase protein [Cantharellus anzutake]|uniref:P-loop containing nucleoside triphosphate hydrolase protein n=1 Tax=Cantharellus anzutake TaxID=1750568 RepID=UPI0019061316|nr:P-loop containing nucleoside triphosphate hydrolase protein [Cantharellus anzutake]KAF8340725.1 P-loop containing nucleoside triphosphate hydrolase protein [Cantharellus anzutake]
MSRSTSTDSQVSKLKQPFTTRPRSQASNYSDASSTKIPLARSNTPSLGPVATKVKAALSSEARLGIKPTKKAPMLRPISRPASPTKRSAATPSPTPFVRDINPEEGLVDWTNVEADLSLELDDKPPHDIFDSPDDKVLVSIRVKPIVNDYEEQSWIVNTEGSWIKLHPNHAKITGKAVEHHFDAVLTGSDNKSVYNRAARSHVRAAMEGYNSIVFAYGQTASGKTFTLMGDENEPGIIPRAIKDVFGYIRNTSSREFLLRASYLEIYNETVYDLLAPSSVGIVGPTITDAGVVNLREEVVTSLKGIKDVLERGDSNRRTASTDWNERSSRSHSVFRLVIESREVLGEDEEVEAMLGTPSTPRGTRLQSRGGRAVQSSVLSLIDLAGSEKATSDKDRTREGKYINTSLLTLGTVIATLAENASRGKSNHVPYRNSKLTRMLQPSLSGNARISVICTLNSSVSAIGETTSTLGFASRIKKVKLHATKKEVIDTEALLERYRKEIEELRARLAEREREAPVRNRRLSARQKIDESRTLNDMSGRIKQLTKLILTSQTVDESRGDQSCPSSPTKLDFSQSPYELQKELLVAKEQLERQATLILSLEASLEQRAVIPLDSPEHEKDAKISELSKQVKELEFVTKRYEENLGEPLRAVKEDVEKEWIGKVEGLEEQLRTNKAYALECERALDKERQTRKKLEEEKRALVAFVTDLDSALPSLRGHAPLNIISSSTPPPLPSSSTYRPPLSPLNESDPNASPSPPQAASPTKSRIPTLTSPSKQRISSFTMPSMMNGTGGENREGILGRATLFDQPPVDDLLDGEASFTGDGLGIEDKENRSV